MPAALLICAPAFAGVADGVAAAASSVDFWRNCLRFIEASAAMFVLHAAERAACGRMLRATGNGCQRRSARRNARIRGH